MIGRPLHRVGLSAHIEFSVSFHCHAAHVKCGCPDAALSLGQAHKNAAANPASRNAPNGGSMQHLRNLAFAGALLAGTAAAQTYPARPVRMLYILIDGKLDPQLAAALGNAHA